MIFTILMNGVWIYNIEKKKKKDHIKLKSKALIYNKQHLLETKETNSIKSIQCIKKWKSISRFNSLRIINIILKNSVISSNIINSHVVKRASFIKIMKRN